MKGFFFLFFCKKNHHVSLTFRPIVTFLNPTWVYCKKLYTFCTISKNLKTSLVYVFKPPHYLTETDIAKDNVSTIMAFPP